MNSFQINFEAARQQGFRDATNPPGDAAWRKRMDESRQKLFGTTYARGYELGRRQGQTVSRSGESIAEKEETRQRDMIDGLALRLQQSIMHSMTVVCRQDAEAKATKRAAKLYGYDRVFNCVLHPRARAQIDEFIKLKADEYEVEFQKSHTWNTHFCEDVQNDLRLLRGRVQDRSSSDYIKMKIAEAKRIAESTVKQKQSDIIGKAGRALAKIKAYANLWKEKTGGDDMWKHPGHARASGWEKASNRAEALAPLRSRMFPSLLPEDTTEQDAWADDLFNGRIYLNAQNNYPAALRGFSSAGIKIWLWWMVNQIKEKEKEEERLEADFQREEQREREREEQRQREREEKAQRERLRQEEIERRAELAVRLERERQEEDERRRQEAERAAREKNEAAQRLAAERKRAADEKEILEQIALQEAEEAREAEEALREQHEKERAQEENILATVRAQARNAAAVEAANAERDKRISRGGTVSGSEYDSEEDAIDSDVDGVDDADIDAAADEEVAAERADAERVAEEEEEEANRSAEEIAAAQEEIERQKPENVAARRKQFMENDKDKRMNRLTESTTRYEEAKGSDNEIEALREVQEATEYLFDQSTKFENGDTYENPNGVSAAERLFLAISLDPEFFGDDSSAQQKVVDRILKENDEIKQGLQEGVAIEDDEIFNNYYVAALQKSTFWYAEDPLRQQLSRWKQILRMRERVRTTRQTSKNVRDVVNAFEEDEDEEEEPSTEPDLSELGREPKKFSAEFGTLDTDAFLEGKSRFGNVIEGDRLTLWTPNQMGTTAFVVVLRGGRLKLEAILDSDSSGSSSDDGSSQSLGVVGIPVAQPMAFATAVPVERHARAHNAFMKVVFKHASAIASRFAPVSVKKIMPKPAAIPPAVPMVMASVKPTTPDSVKIYKKVVKPSTNLAKGSLFLGDVPIVPEGMSR